MGGSGGESAADRYQIFEQVALERLRSGSDATRPVGFLPLPVRITALSAASITALGVLWSIFARVPVQVNGLAVFVPEVPVSSAVARVNGILYYQVSGLGSDRFNAAWRQGNQRLADFWAGHAIQGSSTMAPDILNSIVATAMEPSRGQPLIMPESSDAVQSYDDLDEAKKTYRRIHYPANTLIAEVDSISARAQLEAAQSTIIPKVALDRQVQQDQRQRVNAFERSNAMLRQQIQRQRQELAQAKALYFRLQKLWQKGYLSTSALLQEQSKLNAMEAQLLQLDRERTGLKHSAVDAIQLSSQAGLTANQGSDQLQTALVAYLGSVYTIAPSSGMYLFTQEIRNGAQVEIGDEMFTFTAEPPTLPKVIPVFVDAVTVQQIEEGMDVLVTPKGVSRAQYGGIRGRVTEVGRLSLASSGLQAYAGGRAQAAAIQGTVGTAYLVRVELQQAEPPYCQQLLSKRCYRWSTSRRPPFPVRLGTQADVQINTIYRRPIEFVMPALRQALGIVVDNR